MYEWPCWESFRICEYSNNSLPAPVTALNLFVYSPLKELTFKRVSLKVEIEGWLHKRQAFYWEWLRRGEYECSTTRARQLKFDCYLPTERKTIVCSPWNVKKFFDISRETDRKNMMLFYLPAAERAGQGVMHFSSQLFCKSLIWGDGVRESNKY